MISSAAVAQVPSPVPPPPPTNDGSGIQDDIEDIVDRLNRAVANLPLRSVDGSSTTAPPRYEAVP